MREAARGSALPAHRSAHAALLPGPRICDGESRRVGVSCVVSRVPSVCGEIADRWVSTVVFAFVCVGVARGKRKLFVLLVSSSHSYQLYNQHIGTRKRYILEHSSINLTFPILHNAQDKMRKVA